MSFGRKKSAQGSQGPAPQEAKAPENAHAASATPKSQPPRPEESDGRDNSIDEMRSKVFRDLVDTLNLADIQEMDRSRARQEVSDYARAILGQHDEGDLTQDEQEQVIDDICNDVFGFGPLEPLLARDDVSDIMVNGPHNVFIEVGGKTFKSDVKFKDETQLINICRRIVGAVGRRIDESNPMCDARLPDGSRVNVIAPPLAIDGTTLTIRKFKKDKLTLDHLVKYGSITEAGAQILRIASRCRCNILISGGTGSGKTTLLNSLTGYIDEDERIITCEDAAELQLQQPHVVRLETRPPNLEGSGEVTMRDLVKNCLRMRPERIIVGEVRGPEAFDLLQAMNTGHDGSMGTVHANTPRDALKRVENQIAMGNMNLPTMGVREQLASALDIVVQASRLRDGSRRITAITEVVGMENDTVTTQDLMRFETEGEDSNGNILGSHVMTGVTPKFTERARGYGLERDLKSASQPD